MNASEAHAAAATTSTRPPLPPQQHAGEGQQQHQQHHQQQHEEELPPPRRAYGTFLLADDDEEDEEGLLEPTGRWARLQQRLGVCVGHTVVRVSAVFIAVFITVIDNLPYGLLIFPPAFNLSPLGVQLVLVSAVVSQATYGAMSSFPCALGSFIIENVAFLRAMSTSLSTQLQDQGRVDEALMTILFCFSLSTFLTGVAFYTLGVLQLGKISSFVPQHVLLGCIGGMGTFIVCEGIGISTGIDWGWEPRVIWSQLHPSPLLKIVVTGGLTVGLSVLKSKVAHPVLTPAYFLMIPLVFYAILHLFGISVEAAQDSGWLFSFAAPAVPSSSSPLSDGGGGSPSPPSPPYGGETQPSSIGILKECRSFPGVLACLDLRLIAWDLVPTQLFTFLGLIFFSLIHVPVNVPALAATTGVDADLNKELKAHGVSNLLSGLFGALQNYMAYSTSALYFKTGGDGRLCSFVIAGLLGGFLLLGPEAINYFPRPLAGCLLLHLGAVLLYESLVETWHKAVDLSEYATIWTITLSMTIIGFLEGVGIGLLIACGIFVVQCSRVNPIGSCFPGDGLSSKEMRSAAQRKLLDYRLQGSIYIIRLRGNLFFGNVEQLWLHVREVLVRMQGLTFLVLDTGEMVGIDFSARERLARICKAVTNRRVHLVWAGLHKPLKEKLKAGGCFENAKMMPTRGLSNGNSPAKPGGGGRGWSLGRSARVHHFAKDLNKAFTFCEDAVLTALGAQDRDDAGDDGAGGRPGGAAPPTSTTDFLLRTLKKLAGATELDEALVARLVPSFTREVLPAGATLWRRNDPSTFACIVQRGMLGVPRQKDDPSVSASLAQAPALMGGGGGGASSPPPFSASSSSSTTHIFGLTNVADDDEDHNRYTAASYQDLLSISTTVGGGPGEFVEYSVPGQMSGELGLFTKALRRYTMVAVVETVIWRIDAARLARMREMDPQAFIVVQRIALSYASHRLNCFMLQGGLHSV